MSTQETEELIIKLLKKLQRKGRNIPSFLWRLMDTFDAEQFDEKNNDENKFNNEKITLLYDETDENICKVGHTISLNQKHLSIDPCIICGHRNNNNAQHETKPDNNEILKFLNGYQTDEIQFGPHEHQKEESTNWVGWGLDKKWPLHYAALTGDITTINQLCKNKNINVDEPRTDYFGYLPITFAARFGQLESAIELIKNGSNIICTPDKSNQTPYKASLYNKHYAIVTLFKQYIKFLYNFEINKNTNVECNKCYNYDLHFNKHMMDGTMAKYIYCVKCTLENVKKVKKIQTNNLVIERRIIKTIKENPSISVDTLCQMKDVKSLHTILQEVIVSGQQHSYTLWLLDIDNFKEINTQLTHVIADTKIQELAQVLKNLETLTWRHWSDNGCYGVMKVWAFRQGGDEFALVIWCNRQKISALQKVYEMLKNNINKISLENMKTMKHITVSIGICLGDGATDYQEMMTKADEVAETVKKSGKNNIAIYYPQWKKIYKDFNTCC